MSIMSDFEMAASAPDEALAKAVRDPMASPISQIAALSELRNRQQMRAEASAMQASQRPTVADQTLAPIGYARGGLVQAFADGSRGPVRQPRDIQIDPYYQKLVNDYIARAEKFESKGNPNARPIYNGELLSSASGRFQMIDSTRRDIDRRYGFDPKDRSAETERKRMMVYTNDTINQLEKADIPITGGTLYGGHLLGQQGIEKFMKAYAADPNMRAQDFFSPEVIRVNPAIFDSMRNKKLTTQTNKTLADVMSKLDQVGIGKATTPRRQEDSDIGAALQFANRVDTGDTGAGYRTGPGYEDANLALANMLAQNPGLIATIGKGRQEAPEQQSFFYNPAPQGPSINPADEAEDMDIINQARERDRERMRRYREQLAGSMPGFKGGGIVQHFRDGKLVIPLNMDPPGAVRRPDGTLILPMYPDRSAPGPGYDPLAYTGALLGQPDMPPSPEPMTGLEAIGAMTDYLPEGFAPSAEDAYKAYRSSRDESLQRIRDIAAQKNPNRGAAGALLYEIGRFGDQILTGAIPAGIDTLGMGVTGLYGTLFEEMQPGAWDEKTGDRKVPIERAGKKTPAAPAPAPPRTKQRAGAGTNAGIAAGTNAGLGAVAPPASPSGSGIGAGGAAGTKPIEASPYGPMEQFVRDLYARDEERRARMTEREEEAKSMARLKAGLAIMGGKSPYFAQNLANALPVIQQYEQQMAGMASDEDQFEQELRQRLIGARTGDIQMQAMQQRQKAEYEARAAEAYAKIKELEAKGQLGMSDAVKLIAETFIGTAQYPGPWFNLSPQEATRNASALAAQMVTSLRQVPAYERNASGNAIKAPGVQ